MEKKLRRIRLTSNGETVGIFYYDDLDMAARQMEKAARMVPGISGDMAAALGAMAAGGCSNSAAVNDVGSGRRVEISRYDGPAADIPAAARNLPIPDDIFGMKASAHLTEKGCRDLDFEIKLTTALHYLKKVLLAADVPVSTMCFDLDARDHLRVRIYFYDGRAVFCVPLEEKTVLACVRDILCAPGLYSRKEGSHGDGKE